jgi:hypothetical protein
VAEIHIPTGPLAHPPNYAILTDPDLDDWVSVNQDTLLDALEGVELGAHDRGFIARLAHDEPHTVATICSLLGRARAAETQGRIVLDEVDEMGITDADEDRDLLLITNDAVKLNVHGPYYMDADEAEEWAAHLATMARALRQQAAARGDS